VPFDALPIDSRVEQLGIRSLEDAGKKAAARSTLVSVPEVSGINTTRSFSLSIE
jgi:hypothetical protein